MKKRRIFVAVDLPGQVKKKLLAFQKDWNHLPVRWTKEANLHLTLVFIGYVDDDEMLEVCRLAKEAVKKHSPFEINFNEICLGPPAKSDGWPTRPPRMIWLSGEKSLALADLKNDLEEVLLDSGGSGFNRRDNRAFNPHITLARIRQAEWKQLSGRPEIEKQVSFIVPVESVMVMESHLSRSGAEYAVLENIGLGM